MSYINFQTSILKHSIWSLWLKYLETSLCGELHYFEVPIQPSQVFSQQSRMHFKLQQNDWGCTSKNVSKNRGKHTNLNRHDDPLAKDALHCLLKSLPTNLICMSRKLSLDVITGYMFLIIVKLNLTFYSYNQLLLVCPKIIKTFNKHNFKLPTSRTPPLKYFLKASSCLVWSKSFSNHLHTYTKPFCVCGRGEEPTTLTPVCKLMYIH